MRHELQAVLPLTALPEKPPVSYFNTTHLRAAAKAQATVRANRQERAVLAALRGAGQAMTPSAIHARLGERWPLTSTRRAMSVLTRKGLLVKTTGQRIGSYGAPEHLWRIEP